MPEHDDDLIFDYHEHHGLVGLVHNHDRHPYHHHDRGGSVYYYRPLDDIDGGAAAAALIGDTGYDITLRTPRTTRPAP